MASDAMNQGMEPVPGNSASAPVGQSGKPAGTVTSVSSKNNLLLPGDIFAGRYRIEKNLGAGSLCNAYLCRDSGSGNREVVLKVMHARKAVDSSMAESFLFLAESVAAYQHKGIAKIFEFGKHQNLPFYTMEFVTGTPLRLWLMERLNFENRVLPGLGIIRSLLEIFETIQERGCYGCLKPENVFVTLNGPVVMDFGAVGFLSPQEFEFNSYARRYLPYMAPELRQDWSNLLPQSDCYSLGAILYEIMVGRPPAPQIRLPSELSHIFNIEADEIILKSMAILPQDRFATLESFAHSLELLQSSLLSARPAEGMLGNNPTRQITLESTKDSESQPPPAKDAAWLSEPVAPIQKSADPFAGLTKPEQRVEKDEDTSEFAIKHAYTSVPSPSHSRDAVPEITEPVAHAPVPKPSSEKAHSERRFVNTITDLPQVAPEFIEPPLEHVIEPTMEANSQALAHPTESEFSEQNQVIASHFQRDSAGENSTESVLSAHANNFTQTPVVDAGWRETGPGLKSGVAKKKKPKYEEEIDASPVPAWLWVVLALVGCSLMVGSAYLGLRLAH